MSAFVVEDHVINRVIGWLNAHENRYFLEDIAKIAQIANSEDDWRTKLGASMFQMNCDAVDARYGEGQAAEFRPLNYEFHFEMVDDIQVLKSLQCWLYQCSEGDVPERTLYKEFRDLERVLACQIVQRLPAYDAAKW